MAQADRTELERMRRHLSEVEAELARYAAAYGLTDHARWLMVTSPLSQSDARLILGRQASGLAG